MRSFLDKEDRGKVGVYIAHNAETGYAYIGSGVLGARLSSHSYQLKNNRHPNPKFQEAYNANPNFDFVPVVIEHGREAALEAEQSLINEHADNQFLLNIALDVRGTRLGTTHSSETREKISKIKKEQWLNPEYREKTLIAQKAGWDAMSEEDHVVRGSKISESLHYQYASGQRVSLRGQVRSAEFREQTSQKVKDLWQDPAWRSNMLEARKGKVVSPKKRVIADGVTYESMTAAADAHGITKQSVKGRIDSPKFNWAFT